MRKIFKEIWNVMKLFPLTSYGIFLLLIMCFLDLTNSFQAIEASAPGFPLFLFLIAYPLRLISSFINFVGLKVFLDFFYPQLIGICIFLFLLDLLILSLRTGSLKNFLKKTYHKLTKPKK